MKLYKKNTRTGEFTEVELNEVHGQMVLEAYPELFTVNGEVSEYKEVSSGINDADTIEVEGLRVSKTELLDMTGSELVEVCNSLGISVNTKRSKQEIVKQIFERLK